MQKANFLKTMALGVSFMVGSSAFAQDLNQQRKIKTSVNTYESKSELTLQPKTQKRLEELMKASGIQHAEFKGMAAPGFDFYGISDKKNVDEVAVYETSGIDKNGKKVDAEILFGFKNLKNSDGLMDDELDWNELKTLNMTALYNGNKNQFAETTVCVQFHSADRIKEDKEFLKIYKGYKKNKFSDYGYVMLHYQDGNNEEIYQPDRKLSYPYYIQGFDCSSDADLMGMMASYLDNFEKEYNHAIKFVTVGKSTNFPVLNMSGWSNKK